MILWLFLTLLLLLPTGLFAKEDKVPADVDEATKWVTEGIKHTGCTVDRLDEQYVLYSCGSKSGIALARITSIQGDCWQDYTRDQAECLPTPYSMTSFGVRSDAKHAGRFADGLKYLAAAARQQALAQREAGFAQFSIQAKAWREVSPKPAMPDAAHEHQVLAEYAFKERATEKSIREYQSALDIFPTWPEGQFNLATLAGEQKDYDVAIFHMKEYLELVPDSPDASAAKDSIIIWKDKLNSIFGPEANTVASGAKSRAKSK
jgi:tetratricopeptide (TPR) repeat protein